MAQRLAVIFRRFGPYHIARLNALAQNAPTVFGLEICAQDETYSWEPHKEGNFIRRTLFQKEREIDFHTLRKRLGRALDEWKPDVVAVPGWGYPEGLLGLGWGQRHNVPCVIMSDSRATDVKRHRVTEAIKSVVVRSASAGLVAGEEHKNYLMSLGMPIHSIATGYDVVDNEHFTLGARSAHADPEIRKALDLPKQYFLYLGRFVEKKNLLTLISAYNDYRNTEAGAGRCPIDLVLTGDGPLREQISLASGEGVHFRQFASYEETPALLGLAEGLVLPSRVDQWGLVVNEAMASGCVPLVSSKAGAAELIEDGVNGFVVEPTREGIASGMSRISRADRVEIAAKALESISDWGPERFASGLLAASANARRPSRFISQIYQAAVDLLAVRAIAEGDV